MRPSRLRLSAFGAYAGELTLDFDAALRGHRLFLIHGPTGAGKTTVLDGLCYALFGQSSGEERQAAHLRSHLADPTTRTEAELIFVLGAARFRILRQAEWLRPARRGGGMAKEAGNVLLWRLEPSGERLIAEGERDVAPQVEALLGYKAAEFRQVVLLPQGRFRELLTVDRGKRQEILSRLFRTALYRRVTEQLLAGAKQAEGELKRLEERRRTLLDQAEATDVEAARAAREALAQELAGAESARDAAALTAQAARREAQAGERDAALLKELTEAEAEVSALRARDADLEADKARLAAARRANRLRGLHAEAVARQAAAVRAQGALDKAEEAARKAEEALGRARDALADVAARQAAREQAQHDAARLDALAGRAGEAEQAARLATAAADKARAAETALARAAQQAGQAGQAAREAEATHAASAAVAAQLERHRLTVEQSQRLLRDREALRKARTKVDALAGKLARQEADGHAAATRLAAAEAAEREAEALIARDQAAHLATALADGSPCPVCGAPHHPSPARPVDGALPALPPLREATREAREALALYRQDFAVTRGDLRGAEEERDRLLAEVDEAAPPPDIEALTAAQEVAQAAADALPELARRRDAARHAAEECATQHEAARSAAATARAEAEGKAQARDALLAALPGDIAEAASLAAQAEAAAARAKRIADTLDRDRKAETEATTLAATSGSRAETARRDAADRQDEAAKAEAALLEACIAAGFATREAFAVALLDETAEAALARSVEDGDAKRSAAAARAEAARRAAKDLVTPDIVALQAARDRAEAAERDATDAAGALRERLAARDTLLADIAAVDGAHTSAEADWSRRQDLADLAAGKSTRQRLDLEGFVLRSLLDEALAAANRRLRTMLGGRYSVRRVEEPERKNAAIGLDIEVLDAHTGEARPAGTLSGGEGFCAALALALGLSDTVQAHAGARRIDALFVDEGFGTLDPEALETALAVLSELQAGDRLVGVISHVPELRTRIPARLEVTPGPRGSSAAFRFG
jgi:exonuclease SbcC